MRIKKNGLLLGLVLGLALGLLVTPARAADPDKETLFMHVTSDDIWRGGVPLWFASRVLEAGRHVVVWLNVEATRLGSKTFPQHTLGLAGKNPHELIQEALELGGEVYICLPCMKQAGLTEEDIIPGVKPVKVEIVDKMFGPNTRVLTF